MVPDHATPFSVTKIGWQRATINMMVGGDNGYCNCYKQFMTVVCSNWLLTSRDWPNWSNRWDVHLSLLVPITMAQNQYVSNTILRPQIPLLNMALVHLLCTYTSSIETPWCHGWQYFRSFVTALWTTHSTCHLKQPWLLQSHRQTTECLPTEPLSPLFHLHHSGPMIKPIMNGHEWLYD